MVGPRLFIRRWINLWWPAEIGEDIASEECIVDAGASELGALVFVGNLALVVGILLGVFFLHVVIVSGVEAYWLTKVRRRPLRLRVGFVSDSVAYLSLFLFRGGEK